MKLLTKLCLPLLQAVLSLCLPLPGGRKLTEYTFPVYTTEFCPRNEKEWNMRSSAFNCPEEHSYACFPNENITVLIEFCYPLSIIAITKDVCLFLSYKRGSKIDSFNCTGFLDGCPRKPYRASTIYEYPNCVSIGNGCFTAEPNCQSSTQKYTEETNTQPTHKKNMTYNKKIQKQENGLNIFVIYATVVITIIGISGVLFCRFKTKEEVWNPQTRSLADKTRSQQEEEEEEEDEVVHNEPVEIFSANLGCDFYESATGSSVPSFTSNLQSRNSSTAVNIMPSLPQTMEYPNPPYTPLESPNPNVSYPRQMGPNISFPGPSMQQQSEVPPTAAKEIPAYLFLCLSNLNPATTEETLTNFVEAGLGNDDADIEEVVYNEDRTIAVVQFSSPVDDTALQKRCKKKQLKGKSIAVSQIDPLKFIVVSTEDDVTEETLKTYFQSPESQGGDVQRVSTWHESCYKVKFRHEEDVVRVCKKSSHRVSNTTLTVTPMFITDEAETVIYDVSKHTVPLPSSFIIPNMDPYFQTFLQQSNPALEQLNSRMNAKFAKVIISGETKIECLLSQKTPRVREIVKVWAKEAKEQLNANIRHMLQKSEIIVKEDAWSEVESFINQQNLETDMILTYYEKSSLKIVFFGVKMTVKNLHNAIIEKDKEIQKNRIRTEEKEYHAPKLRLLQRSGIIDEVNMMREDLKADADYQSGKITFTGKNIYIIEAKIKLQEKVNEFDNWKITEEDLSKSQLRLLAGEPVKSLLESKFLENSLTVEMEFEGDFIKVYTLDGNQRSPANEIIKSITTESEIPLDAMSVNVLQTNEWNLEVEKICLENMDQVKINTIGDARIVITATSDLHDAIKQNIEKFIRDNSIYHDAISITDDGTLKFVSKHCTKKLERILEKNKQFFLMVDLQNSQLLLSGSKKGLAVGKQDIEAMILAIGSEEKTYCQPGICKILTKDQTKMAEIEDTCCSVITFPDPKKTKSPVRDNSVRPKRRHFKQKEIVQSMTIPPPIRSGPYCCAENNIKIILIKGDLAKQEGDVIVCSVGQDWDLNRGKSIKGLLHVGGQGLIAEIETRYPNGVKHGEVATISGGNLQCQELYLGCLPGWKHGNGKVLMEFMTKCLEKANSSSHKSIVFPAMGTGQLGYPRDQVAAMMYQTVLDYDRKAAGTQITKVKFVCYGGDPNTVKTFEAEEKHQLNPSLPRPKVETRKCPIITKNKMKISIVKNEIEKHSANVLVVAADKSLVLSKSGASAKSVLEIGGDILQEVAKLKYPNGIANFDDFARIQAAGNLKCLEVHLTSIPESGQKAQSVLCDFVTESMKQADQSGYKSIGFAAMGTGSTKYPAKLVAKTMYQNVMEYSNNNPNCSIRHVQFVLHPKDRNTIQAFEGQEEDLLTGIRYSSDSDAYTTPNHGIVVTVKAASITKRKDDVIVVTAKPELDLKETRVTKAALKEGGNEIHADIKRNYPKGITEGNLAIVTGGNLGCKEIFIGTLPNYTEDPNAANKVLHDMIDKCMTVANQKGYKSICFPCLGTGYNGYPHLEAAGQMLEAITDYDKRVPSTTVKKVKFVALNNDRKSLDAFKTQQKMYVTQHMPPQLHQTSTHREASLDDFSVVEQSVTVKIYGDKQNIQDTDHEITRFINSQCTKAEITDELLNGLDRKEIKRIQNPYLYQQYAVKKAHIEQHVDQSKCKVKQDLWHGTTPTAIRSINYHGFNRRYCGNNSKVQPWFGQGVYFANDASYSARDWLSQPDESKRKKMYLAHVITGHYCAGTKGMSCLPERMPGVNFDSAVNDVSNPLEFVIFHDTQAYPMYCIEFTI
uniref:Poly [ADP-ribose] polymerase n=1 Tax=Crassostrea virginica TaxID=6565 RepID=A0A8B8E6G0_CRAVI|nr:poly [ADP-ribose] polymerase 14-like [Crassostrea virginica]